MIRTLLLRQDRLIICNRQVALQFIAAFAKAPTDDFATTKNAVTAVCSVELLRLPDLGMGTLAAILVGKRVELADLAICRIYTIIK